MNRWKMLLFAPAALLAAACGPEPDGGNCPGCTSGGTGGPPPSGPSTSSSWASSASASSQASPSGSSDYAPSQATGSPDVGVCGDSVNAWAPADPTATSGAEWIDLTFPSFVFAREVQVIESDTPGAIVEVDLSASDASAPSVVLWSDPNGDGAGPCPGAFVVDVNGTTASQYDTVTVWLDPSLAPTEIDAVQLTGDT